MGIGEVIADRLDVLIAEARASGGSEIANYQLFVERLCVALRLPQPDMAREENALNDYVFERRIDFKNTAKRRQAIDKVLDTLVETGLARTGEYEGQTRYFLPR